MWVFLPIVSLLIRVTVGTPETDSVRSDIIKLESESNDTLDDRIGKPAIDASKKWKREESFSTGRNRKQTDNASDELNGKENLHSIAYNQGIDSDVKIVAKRREPVGSWLDSSQNDKGFQSFDHEKKNPWIYSWGDKRISVFERTPIIYRPIRVPEKYYNWGGKRGKVEAQSKRTKFVHTDRDDKDAFVDRYGVKREVEIGKEGGETPFYIWGGKRARKSSDQESDGRQLMLVKEPGLNDASRLSASFKDEFGEDEDFGNEVEEQPAVETKSEIRTMFDEWDGKRNDFPYRIPLHVINETSENDYMTRGEEIPNVDGGDNNNDNWLMSMPNKKGEQEPFKRTLYYPWGGKRNLKMYDLPNNKGEQEPFKRTLYYPWGGKRNLKTYDLPNNKGQQEPFKKRAYYTWGGKRNVKTYGLRLRDDHFAVPAIIRSGFYPWAG